MNDEVEEAVAAAVTDKDCDGVVVSAAVPLKVADVVPVGDALAVGLSDDAGDGEGEKDFVIDAVAEQLSADGEGVEEMDSLVVVDELGEGDAAVEALSVPDVDATGVTLPEELNDGAGDEEAEKLAADAEGVAETEVLGVPDTLLALVPVSEEVDEGEGDDDGEAMYDRDRVPEPELSDEGVGDAVGSLLADAAGENEPDAEREGDVKLVQLPELDKLAEAVGETALDGDSVGDDVGVELRDKSSRRRSRPPPSPQPTTPPTPPPAEPAPHTAHTAPRSSHALTRPAIVGRGKTTRDGELINANREARRAGPTSRSPRSGASGAFAVNLRFSRGALLPVGQARMRGHLEANDGKGPGPEEATPHKRHSWVQLLGGGNYAYEVVSPPHKGRDL